MPRETVPRRRGRPKTTGARDNAEELRREQIRSAQRTYRLRRDTRIRAMEDAHEELKARCSLMEKALLEIREEAVSHASCEPLAGIVLRRTEQFFDGASSEETELSSEGHPVQDTPEFEAPSDSSRSAQHTFGYFISDTGVPRLHPCANASQLSDTSSPPLLVSPPPPTTYTPQETTFARRLHRLTLEHAYTIFTSPSASPQSIYRTFRLVPCFKDRAKMAPYFLRLLRSDAGQRLELYGLPYYCIGGAGRHYPRADGEVMNLRFPRRIVGVGDGGGGVVGYEERLRGMGYGGVWFDSYEVECYLRERGICPLAHSSVVPVRRTTPDEGMKRGELGTQSPPGESEAPEIMVGQELGNGSDTSASPATASRYFDVDRFLECLCTTASILGRAPGFRKDSVDVSITHALRCA